MLPSCRCFSPSPTATAAHIVFEKGVMACLPQLFLFKNDQARDETDEIMDINAGSESEFEKSDEDETFETKVIFLMDLKNSMKFCNAIKRVLIAIARSEYMLDASKLPNQAPRGSEKIELREDLKNRRGLAVSLEIICHNCGESTSTMSSKISNKCYDVNLRLTYGMRAIGKGGAAARIFCGLMNLPPPTAKFERHNSLFLNVLKTISEDSMNAAVHEAVIANDNNSNIAVAVDGTWHKRGYSSLNGVVCATSVENGKWGNGMSGVLSIFQRSETSRKACYTQYLGDGDSKGFLTIKEAKVYGDTEVEKLECVGHVQKRMGTRLRNILKMSKDIKLSDGKNISGRGRLTLKEVDSIQHYYGLAIRKKSVICGGHEKSHMGYLFS
ncbi:uncharacterized protein TNCV_5119221 [Trichonephila clavipes]|nr:uncharacterized protein TNCV_5119221 [Trichonephila clavipes]